MAGRRFYALCAILGFSAPAYGAFPATDHGAGPVETGIATFYSRRFEGRGTASGGTFRNANLVAAHPTWPFGTMVLVTNVATGDSVVVRIADRGPSAAQRRRGTIIDVSMSAAAELRMLSAGRVSVRVQVLEWGGSERLARPVELAARASGPVTLLAPYAREAEVEPDAN